MGSFRWLVSLLLAFVTLTPAAAVRVERVVDGDTIRLADGRSVRYIGVNTPEVHHPKLGEQPGGREATAENKKLVEGRNVRLEYDVERFDRYGRTLAYVFVGNKMVNAEMVRRGYAQTMTIPPNVKHTDLFLRLEREARAAKRGLWRDGRLAAAGEKQRAAKAPPQPLGRARLARNALLLFCLLFGYRRVRIRLRRLAALRRWRRHYSP